MSKRLIDESEEDLLSPIHTIEFKIHSFSSFLDSKMILEGDQNSYTLLIKPCIFPDYFDKHFLSLKEKNMLRRRSSSSKAKRVKCVIRKSYSNFDSYISNPLVQSSMSLGEVASLSHISLSDSFTREHKKPVQIEKSIRFYSAINALIKRSLRHALARIRSSYAYKTPHFSKASPDCLNFSCRVERYNRHESFATRVVRKQFSFLTQTLENIFLKRSFQALRKEEELIKKYFGNAVKIFSYKLADIAQLRLTEAFSKLKTTSLNQFNNPNLSFNHSRKLCSPILIHDDKNLTSVSAYLANPFQITKSYTNIRPNEYYNLSRRSDNKVSTPQSGIKQSHHYKYLARYLNSDQKKKKLSIKTDLSSYFTTNKKTK